MKKFTFKSFTLKLLALVVAVCAGVAVATVSSEKSVAFAAEVQTASFELTQGASIRDGASAGDNFYGLRFETKINKAWLDENKADKYYYGTLIFPAKNIGAFDENLGSTANKENLEAVKIIRGQGEALTADTTFYASVVYDRATIAELYGLESLTDDQYKKITKNLYAMDMTAISYVQFGDTIKYSAPYTDSMIKVAARLQSNEEWAERAKAYLGEEEIVSIKTYAVDDNNIVKGFDAQNASIVAIGNETLTAGVDYTIENGALTLNADYVKANKGVYEDIFVFDANNNLTIINVLYATDEITTADDYMSTVVYEDYDLANHSAYVAAVALDEASRTPDQQALVDTWAERYAVKDGVYVLANDIDLTGKVIRNSIGGVNAPHWSGIPAVLKGAGFTGTFDGFGHVVSNATVNLNMYQNSTVSRLASTGLFATIKSGAVVRNVAYTNVNVIANSTNDSSTWTGVFTDNVAGTVENVYLDVAPTAQANAGFALQINGTMKNVVINYPFEFDYQVASTTRTMRALYGKYGVGSLAGLLNESKGKLENVYVISKMPINYYSLTYYGCNMPVTDSERTDVDYFYYGDNEDTLWFNHTVNGDKTFDELIAEKGKARRFTGVNRYNSLELLSKDANAKQALIDTGFFKLVNDQIVWKTLKLEVTDSTAIDYEASTGTVDSTVFNSLTGVEKIIVNGIELTEGNGFNYVGDKIVLTQRPDAESTIAGVPYISKITANKSQELNIQVYTEDAIYEFNNVTFWTEIITTGEEYDEKFDYGIYDPNVVQYFRHEGYYTLGNDIDMAGLTVENQVGFANIASGATAEQKTRLVGAGLKGTFDGRGYAIYNATLDLTYSGTYAISSTGFFGAMFEGSIVQNVALLNLTVKTHESVVSYRSWSGILTGNNYDYLANGNPASYNMVGTIKNVYVDIAPGSTMYFTGLVGAVDGYSRTHMENIVVNYPTADFDYERDTSSTTVMRGLFNHYGTGLLYGQIGNTNSHDQIKNVYAISPMPIAYQKYGTANKLDAEDNDFFTYAENETKLWYTHSVLDTLDPDNAGKHTVQTVNANNPTGKARIDAGVRRYDNMAGFTADTSDENQTMTETLTDTGYFKLDEGQLLWHTQKATVENETAMEYDASTGKVDTTAIDWENVVSVSVGSEVLTLENGGIIKLDDNNYALRAKESADDILPGVPFADNTKLTPDQTMTFVVETNEKYIEFANVTYWTAIINTAVDFKTYIHYDPGTARYSTITNKGFYKLANNIDFADNGEGERVEIDYYGRDAVDAYVICNDSKGGFAGVFDGNGYVMDNFKPSSLGLFAALTSHDANFNGPVLKNFAVTNVDMSNNTAQRSAAILAKSMYKEGVADVTIENIYVQVNAATGHMRAGLIASPRNDIVMNNVYVEYAENKVVANSDMKFDADYSDADGKVYVAYNNLVDNYTIGDRCVLFNEIANVYDVDANITNIYVASPQPLTSNITALSGYYANLFTHDAEAKTHSVICGKGVYYGYASNETRSYVPVIKEMKPAFVEITKLDGYIDNTVKTGFFCNVCHEPYATGTAGDACTATADCQGTLAAASYLGLWGSAKSYIWTFHDLSSYVNKPVTTDGTSGIWMFSGVKKYDTPELMAQAGNDYSSFTGETGNGCWTVVDGALTWASQA